MGEGHYSPGANASYSFRSHHPLQGLKGHRPKHCFCLPIDILQEVLLKEQELLQPGILGDDEEEEEEDLEMDRHCAERDSLLSTSSLVSHDSTLLLTSSQASEPVLSRQMLTTFVSGLSDGMDSGYVEDSEENSEWPQKPGSQKRQGHRRPGQKFNRFYKLLKSTSQLVLRGTLGAWRAV